MNHQRKIASVSRYDAFDLTRNLSVLVLCVAATLHAQTPSQPPALKAAAAAGSVNVKLFGAAGDGTTDDTAALNSALAWMATSGECLYFPAGAYKTTAELDWIDKLPRLCLRGENYNASYIAYLGAASIDAAIHVGNASNGAFSRVDITNLGIAANANARYAFHAIRVGPPANMDNVAFMGGGVSSFEGDAWNGQSDLRNLIVSRQWFDPPGIPNCVNGLTFGSASATGGADQFPSSQFTLTMPNVGNCAGIGLNLAQTETVTVNNAQLSRNHQQLYENCTLNPGCNASGDTFNNVLIEAGSAYSQILGPRNTVNGALSNSFPLQISGASNLIEDSVGIYIVQPGALGTAFINDLIEPGSTDAGKGTYGMGNVNGTSGLPQAPPFNSIPLVNLVNRFPQTQLFESESGGVNLAIFGQVTTANPKQLLVQNNPGNNTLSFIALEEGVAQNQTIALNPGGGLVTVNSKGVCLTDGTNCPRGFTGTKTAGSCVLTIVNGIITNVTGC